MRVNGTYMCTHVDGERGALLRPFIKPYDPHLPIFRVLMSTIAPAYVWQPTDKAGYEEQHATISAQSTIFSTPSDVQWLITYNTWEPVCRK